MHFANFLGYSQYTHSSLNSGWKILYIPFHFKIIYLFSSKASLHKEGFTSSLSNASLFRVFFPHATQRLWILHDGSAENQKKSLSIISSFTTDITGNKIVSLIRKSFKKVFQTALWRSRGLSTKYCTTRPARQAHRKKGKKRGVASLYLGFLQPGPEAERLDLPSFRTAIINPCIELKWIITTKWINQTTS